MEDLINEIRFLCEDIEYRRDECMQHATHAEIADVWEQTDKEMSMFSAKMRGYAAELEYRFEKENK